MSADANRFFTSSNQKIMKNVQTKALTLLFVCLLSLPVAASATWWWNNGNDDCNDVPLDGGLSLLAAAGVGYGAKKIAEKRKRNQEQKQK